MNQVWMFPGQGSQSPGMGRQLLKYSATAGELLELAAQMSRLNLRKICSEGPADELTNPAVAEPVITATQVAYASLLLDAGITPVAVAGYSAGEVAAYYAAGVLSREDALRVAVIRGGILARYVEPTARMISVTRVSEEWLSPVLAAYHDVEIAGWNAPDHVTLVGHQTDIASVARAVRYGGAQVADVQVAGRWHSCRLRQAARQIYHALSSIEFRSPQCEVYSSVNGRECASNGRWRVQLALQIARPVRWQTIMNHWWIQGVRNVLEIGTGRTLQGILRRNWPHFDEYQVSCVETASGSIAPLQRLLIPEANPIQTKQ